MVFKNYKHKRLYLSISIIIIMLVLGRTRVVNAESSIDRDFKDFISSFSTLALTDRDGYFNTAVAPNDELAFMYTYNKCTIYSFDEDEYKESDIDGFEYISDIKYSAFLRKASYIFPSVSNLKDYLASNDRGITYDESTGWIHIGLGGYGDPDHIAYLGYVDHGSNIYTINGEWRNYINEEDKDSVDAANLREEVWYDEDNEAHTSYFEATQKVYITVEYYYGVNKILSFSNSDEYYQMHSERAGYVGGYGNQALKLPEETKKIDINTIVYDNDANIKGNPKDGVTYKWILPDTLNKNTIQISKDGSYATVGAQKEGSYDCKVEAYLDNKAIAAYKFELKVTPVYESIEFFNLPYGKYYVGDRAIMGMTSGYFNWFTKAEKPSVKWTFTDTSGKTSSIIDDGGSIAGGNVASYGVNLKGAGRVVVTATYYKGNEIFIKATCNLDIYEKLTNTKIYVSDATYTGKTIVPNVVVKDGTKTLKLGTDYIVTNTAKSVGKATAIITGRGYYEGSISKTFNIRPKGLSNTKIYVSNTTYTGKTISPKVVIKDGTKTLKLGTEYTVKNTSKSVGKAYVTITGKGCYEGSVKKAFYIYPKRTTISSIKGESKSFKVVIKKPSTQKSGYELRYSTSSKMSRAKRVKTTSTVKTIKKLKSKKIYYVQVRTYKKVAGKYYYSSWSSRKKVKTK